MNDHFDAAPGGEEDTAARLKPRGSSQGGLRQYNERVVLQAIRLHGALAGAELARLTHLSAQTISLITKRLLEDGLLTKGSPVRGKVGQPLVPLRLNPDGAFSIGIKIGRRSMDVLLIDFTGQVRLRSNLEYRYADPELLLQEIQRRLEDMAEHLGKKAHARVQGIGIAAPLGMGGWQQLLGFPAELAAKWQGLDFAAEVARLTALPVQPVKDTAAACVAELVAGRGRSVKSFLYLFVDTFIGGGLVLGSQLHAGISGNAGAVGSLPLWVAHHEQKNAPAQLLSVASLWNLEQLYAAAGLDSAAVQDARSLQAPWLAHTEAWLAQAAPAIAQAVNSASCLLDMEGVILDGSMPAPLLQRLLEETHAAFGRYSWEGVRRPVLQAGAIGSDARALGGALLPLYANFAPDRDLFLKAAV